MIQLYAKIHDLIPTEQKEVKAWENADALVDKDEFGHWKFESWLDDFRQNGIKFQLKTHHTGHLADGNFRYWGARHLFEESKEDNYKWGYLPIDLGFLLGVRPVGDIITLSEPVVQYVIQRESLFQKMPIEKGYTTWATEDGRCEYNTLGRGSHPHARAPKLIFYQRR